MKIKIGAILVLLICLVATGYVLKRIPERAAQYPVVIAEIDWSKVVDDPTEHLTISIIAPSQYISPESPAIKLIEERFNVAFDFGQIHPTAWNRKKPMLLASGKIPDVFRDQGLGLQLAVKHGFVLPVPRETLVKYCPAQVKMVNKYAPDAWPGMEDKGVNYGVPLLWLDSRFPRTGVWRKDWLENVGIDKIPETLVEMHEAFKRFTYDDPDGNDRNDTWGMSGDLMSWYMTFTDVFGAYGIIPFDFMLKDGQFIYGGIQPEAKEALKTLSAWRKEGLIHPDFVTDRWYREVIDKFMSGRTGYINYMTSFEAFNTYSSASVYNKIKARLPDAEIHPAILPSGPQGKRGQRVWGCFSGGLVFARHLSSEPQKVIRMLKIINALGTDEDFFIKTSIGEEGKHWEWSDETRSSTIQLEPYTEEKKRKAEGIAPVYFVSGHYLGGFPDVEVTDKYLPAGMREFNKKWRNPEYGMVDAIGRPDAAVNVARLAQKLINFQMVYYSDIIRGERSVDDFEQFVSEFLRQGGAEFIKASRAYFERQTELVKKMQQALATAQEDKNKTATPEGAQ